MRDKEIRCEKEERGKQLAAARGNRLKVLRRNAANGGVNSLQLLVMVDAVAVSSEIN